VRTDESVPGHGLGLAMVRDTVDLYGGRMSIDSSPLGGARFSLRLPGR
jgi:two-component system, OmpR family, sensor histidine kinase PhoQ